MLASTPGRIFFVKKPVLLSAASIIHLVSDMPLGRAGTYLSACLPLLYLTLTHTMLT